MSVDLQISVCLEDEPDIVYPDSDADVPEVDGLRMEPAYSEVQQALAARFGSLDKESGHRCVPASVTHRMNE